MFVVCIVLTMKGELFASELFFHLNCADYTAYLKLIMWDWFAQAGFRDIWDDCCVWEGCAFRVVGVYMMNMTILFACRVFLLQGRWCLNICVRVTARGVLAGKEALWQASSLFWSIDLTALADKDRGAVVLVLLQDWFLHRSKIVHYAEVYKCPWNQIFECINIARRQF